MKRRAWFVAERASGAFVAKAGALREGERIWAFVGGGEEHARRLAKTLNEDREAARAEAREKRARRRMERKEVAS